MTNEEKIKELENIIEEQKLKIEKQKEVIDSHFKMLKECFVELEEYDNLKDQLGIKE
jgi:hypothetical protein